jgi:hypothetical protein
MLVLLAARLVEGQQDQLLLIITDRDDEIVLPWRIDYLSNSTAR